MADRGGPDRVYEACRLASLGLALLTFGGLPFVPAAAAGMAGARGLREEHVLLLFLMAPAGAFVLALAACWRRGPGGSATTTTPESSGDPEP